MVFFEGKNQKTFIQAAPLGASPTAGGRLQRIEVFWFLFSKKDGFPPFF
jgi:hypothetical protein